ncbi:MAG: putative ABC transporter permease [Coriobacteriales bacterium]|jgi:uncharacterized membrane protein|nr:putative ABC transporter permease [Coriobacteriales bacterium]
MTATVTKTAGANSTVLDDERTLDTLNPAGTPDLPAQSHPHEQSEPHHGYIALNYYNLFWIFVICSILGLLLETTYQFVISGVYQSRAGLVWGPFSPIYGCGTVLATVALNRFREKNILLIFAVSMALGMALEFVTSWIMETYFGVIAWDYSSDFGSIDGRTSVGFGVMWGMLGLLWIRFALAGVLHIINFIPWNYHIALTSLMTVFMLVNIAVTIEVINREHERQLNVPATTFIQKACDEYFPDSWCQERFGNMSVLPDTTREKAA